MSARLADDLACDPQTGSFALTIPVPDAVEEPSVEERLDRVEAQLRWVGHQLTETRTLVESQNELLARLVSILGP